MTAGVAGPPGPAGTSPADLAAARSSAPSAAPPSRSRRRLALVLAALLALGAAEQLALPPAWQPSARVLLAAIDGYQAVLSPRLGAAGVRCRFTPTCSRYAEAVIRRDGTAVGVARAAARLLRCGPWTPAGTVDPP